MAICVYSSLGTQYIDITQFKNNSSVFIATFYISLTRQMQPSSILCNLADILCVIIFPMNFFKGTKILNVQTCFFWVLSIITKKLEIISRSEIEK